MAEIREKVIEAAKKIDTTQIPGIEWKIFSNHVMPIIEACFKDPIFQQEFEEWKKRKTA